MGTRGFVGFVVDGQEKIAYNHFDSYPSGLGLSVLNWLETVKDWDILRRQIQELQVVDPDEDPPREAIKKLQKYYDPNVGLSQGDGVPSWYQLLRETQGNIAAMLDAGYIEDASSFPSDSLFAEWGYVIDLDEGVLEAYRGFQEYPHAMGRFASRPVLPHPVGVYYPVALVGSWPLFSPPAEDEFLSTLHDVDDEEG